MAQESNMLTMSTTRECRQFSIKEIEEATNQFDSSMILGQGGEAKVYFAEIYIDSNKTPVAVKHLKDSSNEFEREIHTLSKIQHQNIVSLIGYCDESGYKILVYEYMENGCLSDYLKKKSAIALSWLQRLNICLDVARGLQHLHSETDEFPKGIIHRDVKPGNILLGENWVGKLSDFGMFKLSSAGQDKSLMTTNLKGTSGYYAPEYIKYGRITRKIDVYAFGVVLFQVLCRKMPWDREDESYYAYQDEDLGFWAQQNVDAQIQGGISGDSLTVFTDIIRRSLQANPGQRPTMDGVVLDLQKSLECQESEGSIGFHLKPSRGQVRYRTVKQLRLRKVLIVRETMSIHEACRRMAVRSVDAVLLTDSNGLLCGILTTKDLATRAIAPELNLNDTPLSMVMTRNPIFVRSDTLAIEALQKMVKGKFNFLPVVENDDVIALLDLRNCLYDVMARMEWAAEKGKAILAAVEDVDKCWGKYDSGPNSFIETLREQGMFRPPSLSTIIMENPKIATVSPSDTVLMAVKMMLECGVSSAVVTVDKKPHGILTSKDILMRVIAKELPPDSTQVVKVMTPNPECATVDTSIVDALFIMQEGKFSHLPVLDKDGIVVAIVNVLHLTDAALTTEI